MCSRRHLEDIYDLCWAPDETGLISGSVDQSTIIWKLDHLLTQDGGSGGSSSVSVKAHVQRDHKHYVQGVAWDPLGVYFVSMSSDRCCRVYKTTTKQCVSNIFRIEKQHLFQVGMASRPAPRPFAGGTANPRPIYKQCSIHSG